MSLPSPADIPEAALEVARKALRGCLVPYGVPVADVDDLAVLVLLEIEQVWPHAALKKDVASTTAGSSERADARAGRVRFGFGLPPNVRA